MSASYQLTSVVTWVNGAPMAMAGEVPDCCQDRAAGAGADAALLRNTRLLNPLRLLLRLALREPHGDAGYWVFLGGRLSDAIDVFQLHALVEASGPARLLFASPLAGPLLEPVTGLTCTSPGAQTWTPTLRCQSSLREPIQILQAARGTKPDDGNMVYFAVKLMPVPTAAEPDSPNSPSSKLSANLERVLREVSEQAVKAGNVPQKLDLEKFVSGYLQQLQVPAHSQLFSALSSEVQWGMSNTLGSLLAYRLAEEMKWDVFGPDHSAAPPKETEAEKGKRAAPRFRYPRHAEIDIHCGKELFELVREGHEADSGPIADLRQQFVEEWGLLLPAVQLQQHQRHGDWQWSLSFRSHYLGTGTIDPERSLAVGAHQVLEHLGRPERHPLDGGWVAWVERDKLEHARYSGCRVLAPAQVLADLVARAARQEPGLLVTVQMASGWLNQLKDSHPALLSELERVKFDLHSLRRLLVIMLRRRCPLVDAVSILEGILDNWPRLRRISVRRAKEWLTDDLLAHLADLIRPGLWRMAARPFLVDNRIAALVVEDESLPQEVALSQIRERLSDWPHFPAEPVVIVPEARRIQLERALQGQVAVLSAQEVPPGVQIQPCYPVRGSAAR